MLAIRSWPFRPGVMKCLAAEYQRPTFAATRLPQAKTTAKSAIPIASSVATQSRHVKFTIIPIAANASDSAATNRQNCADSSPGPKAGCAASRSSARLRSGTGILDSDGSIPDKLRTRLGAKDGMDRFLVRLNGLERGCERAAIAWRPKESLSSVARPRTPSLDGAGTAHRHRPRMLAVPGADHEPHR